ncbi:MAG: hypothetical protein H6Q51_835, partial [Deltaproteobacteria bacterium]|nr:hypothetical protein [Deltaproteobacteria bacterium]
MRRRGGKVMALHGLNKIESQEIELD